MASPRANRSRDSAETSTLSLRPWTSISAAARPAAGACMMPWPENPATTKKPGTPGTGPRMGVVIRRDFVEPGPAPFDVEAGLPDGGKARVERCGDPEREVGIEGVVEARRLIRIRVGDQDAAPLAADQNTGIGVDRHRNHRGKRLARAADEEGPRDGHDGTVGADERADAARERPGGIPDGGRPKLAGGRRQAEHPGPVPVDRRHFGSVAGPDAAPRRLAQKEVRQSARIDETVARPERPARDRAGRVRRLRVDSFGV